MSVTERFLKYVKFDTMSDEKSVISPSSKGQRLLGTQILADLKAMGVNDAVQDKYGYIYAKIPANIDGKNTKIGFIAHMDTSPEVSGKNVMPKIVDYNGGDILLNETENIVLSAKDFSFLSNYIGQKLIVTDGTTLLGADDKAGVAEILTSLNSILSDNVPHGEIRVAFTPDEEIGRGTEHFDIDFFDADYAYTVDGGELGEIGFENFNASSAEIIIHGRSVHPGSAKGLMINAVLVAMEFNSLLPSEEIPAKTEKYEGFFHLCEMSGTVENAKLSYIIRDHNKDLFEQRKRLIAEITNKLNDKYGKNTVEFSMCDTYYNMEPIINRNIEIIKRIKTTMKQAGVEPKIIPIRGGTDGALLSYRGLPCPNICTGGENFHSRFEFVSIESMEKTVDIIVNLIKNAE